MEGNMTGLMMAIGFAYVVVVVVALSWDEWLAKKAVKRAELESLKKGED